MDTKTSFRPSLAGYATSLVVALPTALYSGIGGAIVSAVTGSVATGVTNALFSRAIRSADELAAGSVQLEGVLDSSQLDQTRNESASVTLALRQRIVSVAVSAVVTLATSGIVALATNGAGINFNMWTGTQQPTTTTQVQKASEGEGAGWQAPTSQESTYVDEVQDVLDVPATEQESQPANTQTEEKPATSEGSQQATKQEAEASGSQTDSSGAESADVQQDGQTAAQTPAADADQQQASPADETR